ncbi:hypothetical protein [Streptomyces bobili]
MKGRRRWKKLSTLEASPALKVVGWSITHHMRTGPIADLLRRCRMHYRRWSSPDTGR